MEKEITQYEPKNDVEKLYCLLSSRSVFIGKTGNAKLIDLYTQLLILGTLAHNRMDEMTTVITPQNNKQIEEPWNNEDLVSMKNLFQKLMIPRKDRTNFYLESLNKTRKEVITEFNKNLEKLNDELQKPSVETD